MTLGIIALVRFIGLSLSLSGWRISLGELVFLILLSLFWYNGARTIAYNQFVPITGILILGSIWLVRHKQDAAAGFLLAFSQIRPDLAILLALFTAIWSLSRRRYQVTIGLLAGVIFLWVISFLLLPDWLLQWVRGLVGSSGRGDWYGSALSLVANSVPNLQRAISLFLHGLVVIYLAFQWLRLRSDEERPYLWVVIMTLALTTIAGFRVDSGNAILLLPALFLIFRISIDRWGLAGKVVAWLLIVIITVTSWLAVLPLFQGRTGAEPVSLFLVLPALTILGLFWIRWWVIRGTRLPFEVLRDRIGL